MPSKDRTAAKGYVYDRFVVPGEHDGRDEASVKVFGREIVNGAADESEIVARVRVKVVDARVVVTIERADDGLEVLVRWP